jgi:hypothetical protein
MISYKYKNVQIKEAETVLLLMRKHTHRSLEVTICKTQMNMREYIKMDTEHAVCQDVEWVHLSPNTKQQQPSVNTVTSPQIS